ncbi:MAG: glycosyltransferase family 4 protein [Gemmatimonadota bacterium]
MGWVTDLDLIAETMRILILNWKDLEHPAAGGAEAFIHSVAEGLVQRGHEVTLVAARIDRRRDAEDVRGVKVVRRGGRISVYRAARRFWKTQPAGSFDIVVDSINTRPFLAPRWVGDTPVIALIYQLAREVWFTETPLPVAALGRYVLEPWWLRAYRNVPALTISESSAASLREHLGWTDVTVLPMGLEPMTKPDVPKEERPTVVFLGRLVGMKRPEDAIRAFARLRSARPDARLWIIGTGPQQERLRAAAAPGVELLGRVTSDERANLLGRAHVLVATSVREGWGLNVSEAAACGTPSICYSVPGLVDSVAAAAGALVDANPEALGDALIRFFAGQLNLVPRVSTRPWPEVAEVVERRLREVVTTFDPDRGRVRGRGV